MIAAVDERDLGVAARERPGGGQAAEPRAHDDHLRPAHQCAVQPPSTASAAPVIEPP